ncbi:MAG: hypothetical protein V4527_14825 [Pseudomonadota bacterium]
MTYHSSFRAIFPYYANEWINRQRAYETFFGALKGPSFPALDGRSIVGDHGCGTGENLALLLKTLTSLPDRHELRVRAVDQNPELAGETSKRLEKLGIDASVTVGDGLSTNRDLLRAAFKLSPQEYLSVSMVEHVLYSIINDQAKLAGSLNSILSIIHPNGLLISSLSNDSDADEVRQNKRDLRDKGKDEPARKMVHVAKHLGLQIFEIPIKAQLIDPGISASEWGDIASGRATPNSDLDFKMASALKLLEFSVAPYDVLLKRGILENSTYKFSERIKKGFSIDSIIQVIPTKGSSEEFIQAVEGASSAAAKGQAINSSNYVRLGTVKDVENFRPA